MVEFNDVDCECTEIDREVDVETPWTEEDQAAWIEHCGNPVTFADVERREAEFLAWACAQDWAMTNAARIIGRAASTASQLSQVVGPTARVSNPAHHTQVGGSDDGDDADSDNVGEQFAADDDLSELARLRDPDGGWYRTATRVAKYVCRAWATDPQHGDEIVFDVTTDTYIGVLRKYDPNNGPLFTYASYWARHSLANALARLKITIPRTQVRKQLALAEQVLARHADAEPAANASEGVKTLWEYHRRRLQADVDRLKTTIGGRVVVSCDSLDAPITDEDGSGFIVDTLQNNSADSAAYLDEPDATASLHEASGVLETLLSQLTARERQVVGMRHLIAEPLAWHAVASTLLVTPDTAKSTHQQAIMKLRKGAATMGVSLADLM